MSKITFLGVWMTPDVGETVSFCIENDETILVDCGTNIVGSLTKNGIETNDITHLFITHSHGDHISGLPTFLFYRFIINPNIMGKPVKPLHIIGTENTLCDIKAYVRLGYGNLAEYPAITYDIVKPNDNYKLYKNELNIFKAAHNPETIGFSTIINGKKIVYSADSALSEEILSKAEDADILIHDVAATSKYQVLSAAHTICKDLSPMLEKYRIRNVYPVHRLSIYQNNISEYANELTSSYKGNVIIPNDGDQIIL